jgi:hypothetical protein
MAIEPTLAAPNPWPIRAISLLLAGQAVGLAALALHFLAKNDWESELAAAELSTKALDSALFALAYTPVAVALFFNAIAFSFRRRSAWLTAMSLQGVILLMALWLYFGTTSYLRQSPWLYALMAYAVVLVLYLNTADVRKAFLARTPDRVDVAAFERAEGLASQPAPTNNDDERPID